MEEFIDDPKNDQLSIPMEMVQWWEKKRIIYNVILILFTSLILYSLWDYTGPTLTKYEAIFQAVWIVIFGNISYTIGWAGGILRHHYFRNNALPIEGRWILFGLGSLFSVISINFYFVFALDVLFAD